jgi:hypothetical protein
MAVTTENGSRRLQWAHCCSTADHHPRHTHVDETGQIVSKHMDCCATDGCPDGSCNKTLQEVGDKRGDDLVAHLEARAKAQEVNNA